MITVERIPRTEHWAMWRSVVPFLIKGLRGSTTHTLYQVARDLDFGLDDLWIIKDNDVLSAAFLTCVIIDEADQQRVLGVYGLGGSGLEAWAKSLEAAVQAEARRQEVDRIRFCGRDGWSRVLPALTKVREHDGQPVFEMAV